MKKTLLIAVLTAFGTCAIAQETYVGTSTGDSWSRADNATAKNGNTNGVEIKTYTDGDANKSFYGVFSFEFTQPETGREVKSATLRLTTRVPRGDRNMSVYGVNGYIDADNVCYNDTKDDIDAALATSPIATFTLAGQGSKALTDNGLTENYQTIAAWQNTIDLSAYVRSLTTNKFSIIVVKSTDQNSSSVIYSKDYTDLTWNAGLEGIGGTPIAKEDVIPQLTVEYQDATASTGGTELSVGSSKDTYVRKGNTNNYGGAATLELYTFKDDASDQDFVGLMAFDVPAAPSDEYELQSATLRLVTERAKGSITIYPYAGNWEENAKYEEQADAISEARSKEAIATMKLAGQSGKAVTDNGVTMNTVADWTNTIDVTSYVKSLEGTVANLMIVNPANTKTSVKVYTKEAADVTLKDGTVFAATDLVPQLTVVYKKTDTSTGIASVEAKKVVVREGFYTLGGQRVLNPSKGLYIVNGKKVVVK